MTTSQSAPKYLIVIDQFLSYGSNIIFNLVIPFVLSSQFYSGYASYLAWLSLSTQIASGGQVRILHSAISSYLNGDIHTINYKAILLVRAFSIISAAIFLSFILFRFFDLPTSSLVIALSPLIFSFQDLFESVVHLSNPKQSYFLFNILLSISSFIIKIILVFFFKQYIVLIIFASSEQILRTYIYFRISRTITCGLFEASPSPSLNCCIAVLKSCLALYSAGVLSGLATRGPLLVASLIYSPADVSLMALGSKAYEVFFAVTNSLTVYYLPRLAKLRSESLPEYMSMSASLFKANNLFGSIYIILSFFLSLLCVNTFLNQYQGLQYFVFLFACASVLASTGSLSGILMSIENLLYTSLPRNCFGFFLSVPLYFILIQTRAGQLAFVLPLLISLLLSYYIFDMFSPTRSHLSYKLSGFNL